MRVAVERHAVVRAVEHYEREGFDVEDVGSFEPYDLLATRSNETRHVEVKGSTGPAETVELTAGEVKQAQRYQPTDLYVVSTIAWERAADGSIATDGGLVRIFRDWTPKASDLETTSYRYTVPI